MRQGCHIHAARSAVLVLLAALVAASPAGAAKHKKPSEKIVYECANGDLCAVQPTGKSAHRVTKDGASNHYHFPALSADGKKLAYQRTNDQNVYVRKFGGGVIHKFQHSAGPASYWPEFSFNGKRVLWTEIAFGAGQGAYTFRANLNGSGEESAFHSFLDGWLPNGHVMIGTAGEHGICEQAPPSTSCVRVLAKDRPDTFETRPHVSPNGKLLVGQVDDGAGGNGTIVLYNPKTGNLIRTLVAATATDSYGDPVFSPDSKSIAFTHYSSVARRADVMRLPVGGGKPKLLVKNASYPAWSK